MLHAVSSDATVCCVNATLRIPTWIIAVVFAGAVSALAGGYWDDAWHTERGRDEFLIAPHIAIYAGIAVAGGALSVWALLVARRHGVAAVWRHKPLALGLVSVGVTLASGPIDNAWHVAFARDAVIWSPPHMLGIAGTLALGAAILAELARRPERWASGAASVAGALVLASAAFAVVEYETDVPQFDELWYLPALGFAGAIGLTLVRTASDRRWAATGSAAVYTLFVIAVAGFLALMSFPAPALPLLVAPALAVDVAAMRRWSAPVAAAAFTAVLYALYVPVRNGFGDGVRLGAGDVLLGLPLTLAATVLVFGVAAGSRPRMGRAATLGGSALAPMLVVLVAAPAAPAHDPGQGEDAGEVALSVALRGQRATLTAALSDPDCASTEPVAVIARRADETLRAPLRKRGCGMTGDIGLPDRGRWFVYARMRRDGRAVESWLPITVGSGSQRISERNRYAYLPPQRSASTAKVIGGVVLYAGMLALLYATFALVRASRARP